LRRLTATLLTCCLLGAGGAAVAKGKRQPPPPVIPQAELDSAQRQYKAARYNEAIAEAKKALTKNERYTPAMLVMAKAYFKLGKYEWTRELKNMMEANKASDAELSELYHMLAFLEVEKQNTPGAIELFKKAADLRGDNAIVWNNLGTQYLTAKNYKDAAPVLEKAVSLQPSFSKAHLNLGSAYRGLKEYEKAKAEYDQALKIFPNYADAVFNLGILFLDADSYQNMDLTTRLNTGIGYLQRYKQMMGGGLKPDDPTDRYIADALEGIKKEQKRLERIRKQEEKERARQAQKAAAPPPGAPAPGAPAAAPGAKPAPPATPAGGGQR